MLDVETIKKLLHALNAELAKQNIMGELCICGGAAMCLAFDARAATKDIDGIFEPSDTIRKAVAKVAKDFALPSDWLNDAVKGFIYGDPPKQNVLSYSHLHVSAPQPEYMLAMKCIAARFDTQDYQDIKFLIALLNLKQPDAVFKIIAKYYPRSAVPPKTQFLIEELLETNS